MMHHHSLNLTQIKDILCAKSKLLSIHFKGRFIFSCNLSSMTVTGIRHLLRIKLEYFGFRVDFSTKNEGFSSVRLGSSKFPLNVVSKPLLTRPDTRQSSRGWLGTITQIKKNARFF